MPSALGLVASPVVLSYEQAKGMLCRLPLLQNEKLKKKYQINTKYKERQHAKKYAMQKTPKAT